ncbi:hypothetical protein DPMN_053694 [Dreissena polymorpha]|uniref:C1q domain-containing protein n=1 Tax=Dreissena polymorpha TaxID=45954 RepID=A0A9D4HQX1_DREPO|nr:hypothetical protein DPMN_053694 [Dreissena polymorpha]
MCFQIGGGYNTAHGIFDAPSAGLYLFSRTTASQDDDWVVTELIVNGARLIGTDTANADVTPGTAVVLATVNAGDHVFIRRVSCGTLFLTNRLQTSMRMSFTGILL